MGIVLCLSLVMIAIAMVRGIAFKVYSTSDQIWTSFWVQLEACVSVTMVCMTAFRTLFVISRRENPSDESSPSPSQKHDDDRTPEASPVQAFPEMSPQPSPRREWWSWMSLRTGRRQGKMLLPSVDTGATMTGLRTMIENHGRTVHESFGTSDEDMMEKGRATSTTAERN